MFQIRYNVLVNYVDYFVVCESLFDHKGMQKNKILFGGMNIKKKKSNIFY